MNAEPILPAEGRGVPSQLGARMTLAPLTIGAEDSCAEALRLMEIAHVCHLPVLDGDRLVGILTRGDIYNRAPVHPTMEEPARTLLLSNVCVAGVMTYAPRTALPTTLVRAALKVMLEHNISSIPVTQGERVIGIFTNSDALRLLEAMLAEKPPVD